MRGLVSKRDGGLVTNLIQRRFPYTQCNSSSWVGLENVKNAANRRWYQTSRWLKKDDKKRSSESNFVEVSRITKGKVIYRIKRQVLSSLQENDGVDALSAIKKYTAKIPEALHPPQKLLGMSNNNRASQQQIEHSISEFLFDDASLPIVSHQTKKPLLKGLSRSRSVEVKKIGTREVSCRLDNTEGGHTLNFASVSDSANLRKGLPKSSLPAEQMGKATDDRFCVVKLMPKRLNFSSKEMVFPLEAKFKDYNGRKRWLREANLRSPQLNPTKLSRRHGVVKSRSDSGAFNVSGEQGDQTNQTKSACERGTREIPENEVEDKSSGQKGIDDKYTKTPAGLSWMEILPLTKGMSDRPSDGPLRLEERGMTTGAPPLGFVQTSQTFLEPLEKTKYISVETPIMTHRTDKTPAIEASLNNNTNSKTPRSVHTLQASDTVTIHRLPGLKRCKKSSLTNMEKHVEKKGKIFMAMERRRGRKRFEQKSAVVAGGKTNIDTFLNQGKSVERSKGDDEWGERQLDSFADGSTNEARPFLPRSEARINLTIRPDDESRLLKEPLFQNGVQQAANSANNLEGGKTIYSNLDSSDGLPGNEKLHELSSVSRISKSSALDISPKSLPNFSYQERPSTLKAFKDKLKDKLLVLTTNIATLRGELPPCALELLPVDRKVRKTVYFPQTSAVEGKSVMEGEPSKVIETATALVVKNSLPGQSAQASVGSTDQHQSSGLTESDRYGARCIPNVKPLFPPVKSETSQHLCETTICPTTKPVFPPPCNPCITGDPCGLMAEGCVGNTSEVSNSLVVECQPSCKPIFPPPCKTVSRPQESCYQPSEPCCPVHPPNKLRLGCEIPYKSKSCTIQEVSDTSRPIHIHAIPKSKQSFPPEYCKKATTSHEADRCCCEETSYIEWVRQSTYFITLKLFLSELLIKLIAMVKATMCTFHDMINRKQRCIESFPSDPKTGCVAQSSIVRTKGAADLISEKRKRCQKPHLFTTVKTKSFRRQIRFAKSRVYDDQCRRAVQAEEERRKTMVTRPLPPALAYSEVLNIVFNQRR